MGFIDKIGLSYNPQGQSITAKVTNISFRICNGLMALCELGNGFRNSPWTDPVSKKKQKSLLLN